MLAYLRPATLLALALDTVVVADAGAPAYLTLAPHAVMLAYLRPTTLFALALLTVVGADAGAPAYLALAPFCDLSQLISFIVKRSHDVRHA